MSSQSISSKMAAAALTTILTIVPAQAAENNAASQTVDGTSGASLQLPPVPEGKKLAMDSSYEKFMRASSQDQLWKNGQTVSKTFLGLYKNGLKKREDALNKVRADAIATATSEGKSPEQIKEIADAAVENAREEIESKIPVMLPTAVRTGYPDVPSDFKLSGERLPSGALSLQQFKEYAESVSFFSKQQYPRVVIGVAIPNDIFKTGLNFNPIDKTLARIGGNDDVNISWRVRMNDIKEASDRVVLRLLEEGRGVGVAEIVPVIVHKDDVVYSEFGKQYSSLKDAIFVTAGGRLLTSISEDTSVINSLKVFEDSLYLGLRDGFQLLTRKGSVYKSDCMLSALKNRTSDDVTPEQRVKLNQCLDTALDM